MLKVEKCLREPEGGDFREGPVYGRGGEETELKSKKWEESWETKPFNKPFNDPRQESNFRGPPR